MFYLVLNDDRLCREFSDIFRVFRFLKIYRIHKNFRVLDDSGNLIYSK